MIYRRVLTAIFIFRLAAFSCSFVAARDAMMHLTAFKSAVVSQSENGRVNSAAFADPHIFKGTRRKIQHKIDVAGANQIDLISVPLATASLNLILGSAMHGRADIPASIFHPPA